MRSLAGISRIFLGLFIAAITTHHPCSAQGTFGIGFSLGYPTGISWRYNTGSDHAFDGGIGFLPTDRFRLHADYLWITHPFHEHNLSLHYGPGVVLGFGSTGPWKDDVFGNRLYRYDVGFGVRFDIGITYVIPRAPVDVFLEIAPVLVLVRDPGMVADVAVGVRVYP